MIADRACSLVNKKRSRRPTFNEFDGITDTVHQGGVLACRHPYYVSDFGCGYSGPPTARFMGLENKTNVPDQDCIVEGIQGQHIVSSCREADR